MGADGFIMQKIVTIQGPQSSAGLRVTQTESGWFDAGDKRFVELRIVALALTDCELHIQTSPIRDSSPGEAYSSTGYTVSGFGQWRDSVKVTAAGTSNYLLDVSAGASAPPYPLDRFIRWQIISEDSPGSSGWLACFWIALVAKT